MRESAEGRVERLSQKVGGRFKLSTLVQKQIRDYYAGGRTFMPSVRNLDELFHYVLDEIEDQKIDLLLREALEEEPAELADSIFKDDEEEAEE